MLFSGVLVLLLFPFFAHAQGEKIKTANYFLRAGSSLRPEDFSKLISFDILILPMEAQVYNRDFFSYARANKPSLVILAYVPSRSINILDIEDYAQIRKRLKAGIKDDWYLKSSEGKVVSAWPGTIPVNVTTGWNAHLPQFLKETILSTNLWDGIFYDEVQDSMQYLNGGDIDINQDRIVENKQTMDELWQDGVEVLLRNSRELFGNKTIIMTNGSSLPQYTPYVNGRMFENFPAPEEGFLWPRIMKQYISLQTQVLTPRLFVINANTRNGGAQNNYQRVRYSLASTLLGDGYFGFDFGDQDHGQVWQYDEYNVVLGNAKSSPLSIDGISTEISKGVWRRDYEQGVVLVNAHDETSVIDLAGEYEHIHGTQDPRANSGVITDSVSLAPRDGRILLRPLDTLLNASFRNGAFIRILTGDGRQKRTGFFSYVHQSKGGTMIAKSSNNGTAIQLTVSSRNGHVTFRKEGQPDLLFAPFTDQWKDDINISLFDVDNDGAPEVILAPERTRRLTTKTKASPPIKIFLSDTGKELASFYPYGKKFIGSIRIAARLDDKGNPAIVTGTGPGYIPEVKIFTAAGKLLRPGFLAYNRAFKGGVDVAIGDTNGDRIPEIITSPGPGAKPLIQQFSFQGKRLNPGFLGFDVTNTSGVRIASADVDHDGIDEILPMTARVFTLSALKH